MPREIVKTIDCVKYKYYDIKGGKQSIIILHGLKGSKETILGLCKPLKKQYRCIIPDLPEHRGIELDNLGSVTDFANYVLRLCESLT